MQDILKKTAAGNYTSESVKKYVRQIKELYDQDFNEMRSRMMTLRDENRRIREELEEFKAKEKYIAATILKAEQIAQHIRDEAEFQARRRASEAEAVERKAKHEVEQAMERLFRIQKSIAALLNDVVETTPGLKPEEQTAMPQLENAAEVYQFINGISASRIGQNGSHHLAV